MIDLLVYCWYWYSCWSWVWITDCWLCPQSGVLFAL